ncbi:hypothetical protein ABZ512_12280 [Nocardiopsis dassonvillei]|uniref:hypothetical protein n=1 Tax=Nocardiopsis dassonvillei TaxID=2014 RepID=UPI0033CCFF49
MSDGTGEEEVPVEVGEVRVHEGRVQYYDGESWVDHQKLTDERLPPVMRGGGDADSDSPGSP